VTGLRQGENRLTVDSDHKGKAMETRGRRRNSGQPSDRRPILSGPHEQTVRLRDQQFNLPAGLGNLGTALDANCSIKPARGLHLSHDRPTVRAWPGRRPVYPEHGEHHYDPRQNGALYHSIETGTINRAIYHNHDPARSVEGPGAEWSSQPGNWNNADLQPLARLHRRLVPAGQQHGGVTDNFMLSNGYALASRRSTSSATLQRPHRVRTMKW